MNVRLPLFSVLCAASLVTPGVAQKLAFTAILEESQVVPPSGAQGRGTGTFLLDRSANTLTFALTAGKLQSTETEAHLHGYAPAGQNGPILFSLALGKTKAGVWSYPEADEEMIAAGLVYVDIHTTGFPSGQLRGQLVRRPDDVLLFTSIDRFQVTTGSNSNATGTGFLRLDTLFNQLTYDITLVDLASNELNTHIHEGAVGELGTVLFNFPNGNTKTGTWTYPELNEPDLVGGDTYVNVHTVALINGAVRGQNDVASQNPSVWCTPKPNSQGCNPNLEFSGRPDLTGADDLTFTCKKAINQQDGLFFWGMAPKTAPFFGGTLCARAPLVRTPVQNSGGNVGPDDCSGNFSFHFSQAYMASKGLTAGTLVYGQWWSHDPAHPDGTGVSLSDAVQFEIRP